MRGARGALLGVLIVGGVSLMLLANVSPAVAISPPVVDPAALIRSAPVGPPGPTEQRTLCAQPVSAASTSSASAAQTMLNLSEAWRFSRGAGQRVAVIDTGVNPHPRLARIRGGGDYVAGGDGLTDCDAHGTLVAGIIAASPSRDDAFSGVAPDASIISIRQSSSAFRDKKQRSDDDDENPAVGTGYGSVRTLASAVVRAVDLGATVINISEVACAAAGSKLNDKSLGAAVRHAFEHDVVVVVAAGNLAPGSACATQNPDPAPSDTAGWHSVQTIASPAWFSRYVLAVGSVDAPTGVPSTFSLHGPWVDVAAPGTGIVSLDSTPGHTGLVDAQHSDSGPIPLLGTSFATPYVAGTVALVRARFPQLSAAQVMERICATAHAPGDGHDQSIGFGVIDTVAALTAQITPASPVDPKSPQAISAPPQIPPSDNTARNAAVIGVVVALALICVALAVSLPHRKVTRLDPDEF